MLSGCWMKQMPGISMCSAVAARAQSGGQLPVLSHEGADLPGLTCRAMAVGKGVRDHGSECGMVSVHVRPGESP
ncbi:hypothetical protein ABZT45_49860, partial [Streptomyces sp. NPDC005356]|uniref:hypothetical protein n=1 Tax=Streptomyces sp. NPDC005356 TaxID=3157167 RepID=UPI0033ABF964